MSSSTVNPVTSSHQHRQTFATGSGTGHRTSTSSSTTSGETTLVLTRESQWIVGSVSAIALIAIFATAVPLSRWLLGKRRVITSARQAKRVDPTDNNVADGSTPIEGDGRIVVNSQVDLSVPESGNPSAGVYEIELSPINVPNASTGVYEIEDSAVSLRVSNRPHLQSRDEDDDALYDYSRLADEESGDADYEDLDEPAALRQYEVAKRNCLPGHYTPAYTEPNLCAIPENHQQNVVSPSRSCDVYQVPRSTASCSCVLPCHCPVGYESPQALRLQLRTLS